MRYEKSGWYLRSAAIEDDFALCMERMKDLTNCTEEEIQRDRRKPFSFFKWIICEGMVMLGHTQTDVARVMGHNQSAIIYAEKRCQMIPHLDNDFYGKTVKEVYDDFRVFIYATIRGRLKQMTDEILK